MKRTMDDSFTTIRTLSLNNKSGKRGSTLTAKGAGFKNSTTATVFLDSNGDNEKQGAEVVLCDAPIGGTDTFECDFVVNVPPFINGRNTINAIDGREDAADSWRSMGFVSPDQSHSSYGRDRRHCDRRSFGL